MASKGEKQKGNEKMLLGEVEAWFAKKRAQTKKKQELRKETGTAHGEWWGRSWRQKPRTSLTSLFALPWEENGRKLHWNKAKTQKRRGKEPENGQTPGEEWARNWKPWKQGTQNPEETGIAEENWPLAVKKRNKLKTKTHNPLPSPWFQRRRTKEKDSLFPSATKGPQIDKIGHFSLVHDYAKS